MADQISLAIDKLKSAPIAQNQSSGRRRSPVNLRQLRRPYEEGVRSALAAVEEYKKDLAKIK